MSPAGEGKVTGPAMHPALHLLTGPWGAGKSTLVPHLARLLPEVVVFDWDALLPGLSAAAGKDAHHDPSTWDGLRTMWIAIVRSVLAGGRGVLLCGPARPDHFPRGTFDGPVRCAFLDCPDEVLADRLRTRGEREQDIGGELADMAALRASGYHAIPAGNRDPRQIAADAAAWVRAAHASPAETQA